MPLTELGILLPNIAFAFGAKFTGLLSESGVETVASLDNRLTTMKMKMGLLLGKPDGPEDKSSLRAGHKAGDKFGKAMADALANDGDVSKDDLKAIICAELETAFKDKDNPIQEIDCPACTAK